MMNNGTTTHPAIASSGLALNASTGYGNYNGGFITLITQDWHGLLMHNNFTYSKALGTGAFVQATSEYTPNDAFDLSKMYGVQAFNRKFVYNSYMVWQEPYFKGQQGILGRVAGGWSLAPIFTAGNGEPLYCSTQTGGQSFGSADANDYYTNEQCVFTSKYNGGYSSHYGVGRLQTQSERTGDRSVPSRQHVQGSGGGLESGSGAHPGRRLQESWSRSDHRHPLLERGYERSEEPEGL